MRPNRFRFVYKKPLEQTIVADGQTLRLYDVDLAQVTARKQGQVLGSTPAALIASAADLRALEADFEHSDAQPLDGVQWVYPVPRNKDGGLANVRIGLKASMLVSLDIVDSFGQRSVLQFTAFEANPPWTRVCSSSSRPPVWTRCGSSPPFNSILLGVSLPKAVSSRPVRADQFRRRPR